MSGGNKLFPISGFAGRCLPSIAYQRCGILGGRFLWGVEHGECVRNELPVAAIGGCSGGVSSGNYSSLPATCTVSTAFIHRSLLKRHNLAQDSSPVQQTQRSFVIGEYSCSPNTSELCVR